MDDIILRLKREELLRGGTAEKLKAFVEGCEEMNLPAIVITTGGTTTLTIFAYVDETLGWRHATKTKDVFDTLLEMSKGMEAGDGSISFVGIPEDHLERAAMSAFNCIHMLMEGGES